MIWPLEVRATMISNAVWVEPDPANIKSACRVSIGVAAESAQFVDFDQPGIDSNSSNASAVKALFISLPRC
jgi:hypothetical protein